MAKAHQILVVDDVADFCQEIKATLAQAGFAVTVCLSPLKAIRLVARGSFDLLITTLAMKELSGFDVIRRLRAAGHALPIVMITGYGSQQAAIEAIRLGASDYMDKPVAPAELVARVRRLLRASSADPTSPTTTLEQIITGDAAMQSVLEMVRVVAATDSRVLILGETGTGKQLIAQAIHNTSPRREHPFVDVNCAAIPESLLESELFGHEKGAFTGADAQRVGRFEEAGEGTIFLDEIGEMSFSLQSKLLKVLQDGRYNRVGSSRSLISRARVLAATNRDLEKEVAQGRFRSDLYYRLNVLTIALPPLRQRPADVPLLVDHLLRRFIRPGQPLPAVAPDALAALTRYQWPGNIRELEHVIERLAVLHRGPTISLDELPPRIAQHAGVAASLVPQNFSGSYREAKARFERDYLAHLLREAKGNMAQAARLADLDRSQFFRLVQRHQLNPADWRG